MPMCSEDGEVLKARLAEVPELVRNLGKRDPVIESIIKRHVNGLCLWSVVDLMTDVLRELWVRSEKQDRTIARLTKALGEL